MQLSIRCSNLLKGHLSKSFHRILLQLKEKVVDDGLVHLKRHCLCNLVSNPSTSQSVVDVQLRVQGGHNWWFLCSGLDSSCAVSLPNLKVAILLDVIDFLGSRGAPRPLNVPDPAILHTLHQGVDQMMWRLHEVRHNQWPDSSLKHLHPLRDLWGRQLPRSFLLCGINLATKLCWCQCVWLEKESTQLGCSYVVCPTQQWDYDPIQKSLLVSTRLSRNSKCVGPMTDPTSQCHRSHNIVWDTNARCSGFENCSAID